MKNMGSSAQKRPLSGGKSILKAFQVRGWVRDDSLPPLEIHIVTRQKINAKVTQVFTKIVKKPGRTPLTRVEIIHAISGLEACKQYARSHGIKDAQWLATPFDSSPYCVIRCSAVGEVRHD